MKKDTEQKTDIAKVNAEEEIVGKERSGIDALSRRVFGEWTVNELVDKWEQLEGDYLFLKWQLAKLISDKFKSKVEFGQFLQVLRNDKPNHALCTIKQSTFYRYAHAAGFCNKFGIYDLKKIGLSPTAIYELSKIKHQQVINSSFLKEIEKKNLPVAEIERLILQAKNLTIESTSEPALPPESALVAQETGSKDPQAEANADQKPSVMMEAELPEGIELPEAEIRLNNAAEPPVTKSIPLSEIRMNTDQKAQAIFDLFLSLNISWYEWDDVISKACSLFKAHLTNLRNSSY